jgi:hypothetical protein
MSVGVATLPSSHDRLPDAPGGVLGRSRAEHATQPASLPGTPGTAGDAPGSAGARILRLAHGRLTLDELVSGAWAAIGAGAPAACPICDGPMHPAHAGSAECRDCGAHLS